MKKLLALILALLFVLTACEAAQQTPDEEIEEVVVEAAQVQEDSLALISFSLNETNGTDFGYYYTKQSVSQDSVGYVTIRYIDYETKSDLTLCARPECTHDNETCAAFLGSNNVAISVLDDKLYLLYYGQSSGKSQTVFDQTPTYLAVRDLSGENEKTLVTLDIDAELMNAAVSQEHLFALVTYREETQDGEGKVSFVSKNVIEKISLSTGEKEIVYESTYNETYTTTLDDVGFGKGQSAMSGVLMPYMEEIIGDGILFSQTVITEEITGEETPEEYERKMNAMKREFLLYDTITGEMKNVYLNEQNLNNTILESAMYELSFEYSEKVDEDKFIINRIDYETWQKTQYDLTPIFSKYEEENTISNIRLVGEYGDEIIVNYSIDKVIKNENDQEQYVTERSLHFINLEDLSSRQLDLSHSDAYPGASSQYSHKTSILPIIQHDDYFLVIKGVTYTPQTIQAGDGSSYESYDNYNDYALILKEDYFNNVPNYIEMTRIS